jgi:uncharacterized protein (UPF0218 family)
MQTENTHSRSDEELFQGKEQLELPIKYRTVLKDPLGAVVPEDSIGEELQGINKIVTVGDLCSLTLYERDIIPDIAVVDFATRRGDVGDKREKIRKIGQSVINVKNPAGVITRGLWDAVRSAFESEIPVRIEVSGEEDLATLPAVWHAPENTAVIYGLPDVGLILVKDLQIAKKMVKDVLYKMR